MSDLQDAYEAAARTRAEAEDIEYDLCSPSEMVDRIWAAKRDVDAALATLAKDSELYRWNPDTAIEDVWETVQVEPLRQDLIRDGVMQKVWPNERPADFANRHGRKGNDDYMDMEFGGGASIRPQEDTP